MSKSLIFVLSIVGILSCKKKEDSINNADTTNLKSTQLVVSALYEDGSPISDNNAWSKLYISENDWRQGINKIDSVNSQNGNFTFLKVNEGKYFFEVSAHAKNIGCGLNGNLQSIHTVQVITNQINYVTTQVGHENEFLISTPLNWIYNGTKIYRSNNNSIDTIIKEMPIKMKFLPYNAQSTVTLFLSTNNTPIKEAIYSVEQCRLSISYFGKDFSEIDSVGIFNILELTRKRLQFQAPHQSEYGISNATNVYHEYIPQN